MKLQYDLLNHAWLKNGLYIIYGDKAEREFGKLHKGEKPTFDNKWIINWDTQKE